jgi:hypothetical protein
MTHWFSALSSTRYSMSEIYTERLWMQAIDQHSGPLS